MEEPQKSLLDRWHEFSPAVKGGILGIIGACIIAAATIGVTFIGFLIIISSLAGTAWWIGTDKRNRWAMLSL